MANKPYQSINTNSHSSLPPPRPIANGELERYKERILDLYSNNSMEKVQSIMLDEERVYATIKQYRTMRTKWKHKKNVTKAHKRTMIKIYEAAQRSGKSITIYYNQRPWSDAKMRRSLDDKVMDGASPSVFVFPRRGDLVTLPKEISFSIATGPGDTESPGGLNSIIFSTPKAASTSLFISHSPLFPSALPPIEANQNSLTDFDPDTSNDVETITSIEAQKLAAATMTPESVWSRLYPEEDLSNISSVKADLHRRAFCLYKMHCGDGVYDPRKLRELADNLWKNDRFSDAAELDRMTIELAEHFYAPDHAYTLLLKGNLAVALDSLGKYDEAEQWEVSVVNSLVRTLGEDHKDTIFYQANLSTTFRRKGKYESARDLCLEVVEKANKVFGSHDDNTLSFYVNLARAYGTLCHWEEAKNILEVVTIEREKKLGFSDKRTLQACTVFATALRQLGHLREAMALSERIRSTMEAMGLIETVRNPAEALNYPSAPLWTLESLDDHSELLFEQGQYFEAERVVRAVIHQRTKILTDRHPATLRSKMDLACVLHYQHKGLEAAEIDSNVLVTLREVLGKNHPSTLTAMADLAWIESDVLSFESFEAKMTEVLLLRMSTLGETHPHTLQTQEFLAVIQYRKGKLTEGQQLFAHVEKSLVQLFGTEKHGEVIRCILSHANALYRNEQYHEAEILFRKGHTLMATILGEDQPNTIRIAKSLVTLLALQGRYQEAEELASVSISQLKCVFGPEHPLIFELSDAQALLVSLLGKWAESESLRRHLLEQYQLYGADHPQAIFEISNVAKVCVEQGKLDEAERLYNRALDASRRCFGQEHPHTLAAIANIAYLRTAQRRLLEAVDLSNEILKGRTQLLGREHPDTIHAKCRLADVLVQKGDYKAGELLYEQALAAKTDLLGSTHPATLQCLSNLAWLNHERGDLAQAANIYRQVLETSSIVLGEWHPNTVSARKSLYQVLLKLEAFAECTTIGDNILGWTRLNFGHQSWKTALALQNLASLHSAQENYVEAEIQVRRALEIVEQDRELPLVTISIMTHLADYCRFQKKLDVAETQLEDAILLGQPNLGTSDEIFFARMSLARTKLELKKFNEAEKVIRGLLQEQADNGSIDSIYELQLEELLGSALIGQRRVSECRSILTTNINRRWIAGQRDANFLKHMDTIAGLERQNGHFSGSETLLECVLQARENDSSTLDLDMAWTLSKLAVTKWQLGKHSKAEALQRRSMDITKEKWGEDSIQYADALWELTLCWDPNDQPRDSEALQLQVLEKYVNFHGANHLKSFGVLRQLGRTKARLGDFGMAELLQKYVLYQRIATTDTLEADHMWDILYLARTYENSGKYYDAEVFFGLMIKMADDLFGAYNMWTAEAVDGLIAINDRLGRFEEARSLRELALAIVAKIYTKEDSEYIKALRLLGYAYAKTGHWADARDLASECCEILESQETEGTPSLTDLRKELELIDKIILYIVNQLEDGDSPDRIREVALRASRTLAPLQPPPPPPPPPSAKSSNLLALLGPAFSATIPDSEPLCSETEFFRFIFESSRSNELE